MSSGDDLLAELVAFGTSLRDAGVAIGPTQLAAYIESLTAVDPTSLADLYWSGRVCLVNRHGDIAAYDRAFRHHFLGDESPSSSRLSEPEEPSPSEVDIELGNDHPDADDGEGDPSGSVASAVEVLRGKDFAEYTPEELVALAELMAGIVVVTPERRLRRTQRATRGTRLDLRRALRSAVREDDAAALRAWRRPRTRRRTLVLLLDISGSMADYSRALLQFAHGAVRGAGKVEVFCFGTRLTRVTEQLTLTSPDAALARAAGEVHDWEGGTTIGASIGEYSRTWGRRTGFRESVVVICSDGLEWGDPTLLGAEMARLARLSHRIVWVNPLMSDDRYEPLARGMQAALPHVDVLVSGHNLATLEDLAELLPALS